MNSKLKVVLISLLISVILFTIVVYSESQVSNYSPTVSVLFCTKDIKREDPIDNNDFEYKKIPIAQVTANNVMSKSQLKGMYAKDNIYKGEEINKKRIGTQSDIYGCTLKQGERELAIGFQSIDDVVGGTIRKDDMIDMIYTQQASNITQGTKTETLKELQGIRVIGVLDSAGKSVDITEKDVSGSVILLAVKPETANLIENLKAKGKFVIMKKITNDPGYNDITIQDGTIQQNTN